MRINQLILIALLICASTACLADSAIEGLRLYQNREFAQALPLLKEASTGKNPEVWHALGYLYAGGRGVKQDYAEAAKWYTLAAKAGLAKSQNNLGILYANGRGVPKSQKEAIKWYTAAAKQGYLYAQKSLACVYDDRKEYDKELYWRKQAAAQGDTDEQTNIGVMYAKGIGVKRDYAEANRWYKKAADAGNPMGQRNLAISYELGRGVAKDPAKAIALYKQSAIGGHPRAASRLTDIYRDGELGEKVDLAEAQKWRKEFEKLRHTSKYARPIDKLF